MGSKDGTYQISGTEVLVVWENNQPPLQSAAEEAVSTFHDLFQFSYT